LSEWHHQLAQQAPDTTCLPDVLNRVDPSSPVRFVPQAALAPGQSYEHFIFTQRQVPTRDNLHDLFMRAAGAASRKPSRGSTPCKPT